MGEGSRRARRLVHLGDDLDAAVKAFADKSGQNIADVIRRATAQYIGQPELAEGVRVGRPSKPDEPAPAPRKGMKKVVRKRTSS